MAQVAAGQRLRTRPSLPGRDLGYDGRDLEQFSLAEIDSENYDVRWQDPADSDGWLCAVAPIVIEDLEAWR